MQHPALGGVARFCGKGRAPDFRARDPSPSCSPKLYHPPSMLKPKRFGAAKNSPAPACRPERRLRGGIIFDYFLLSEKSWTWSRRMMLKAGLDHVVTYKMKVKML
jgi:hypothetical protein